MPFSSSPWLLPTVVNLTDLSFEQGFKIFGLEGIPGVMHAEGSATGSGFASFYNTNNQTNLLIGAGSADPDGLNAAGTTFMITFDSSAWPVKTTDLSSAQGVSVATFNAGNADIWSGGTVLACDLDNDGNNELILGARRGDPGGRQQAGQTHVVWGQLNFAGTYRLNSMGSGVTAINGVRGADASGPGDNSGISLACGTDDSGKAHLLIGSRYANPDGVIGASITYLLRGDAIPRVSNFELSTVDGTNGIAFYGTVPHETSGNSVTFIHNLLGNHRTVMAIGAPHTEDEYNPDNTELSSVYILFEPFQITQSPWYLSQVAQPHGIVLESEQLNDLFGFSIIDVGDINGDGYGDFAVAAPTADVNGKVDAGRIYLFWGGTWLMKLDKVNVANLNHQQVTVIDGPNAEERLGFSSSSIAGGDFDGNEINDVVVCARYASFFNKYRAGACYLLPGGPYLAQQRTIDLSQPEQWYVSKLIGEEVDDQFGSAVFMADLSQNGFDDILISARYSDPNGWELAGTVYILYGHDRSDISSDMVSPPCILNAEIPALSRGETRGLTRDNFSAGCAPANTTTLTFVIGEANHIDVNHADNPDVKVWEFTQADIDNDKMSVTHDGSRFGPRLSVSVTDGQYWTPGQFVNIGFEDIPLLLFNRIPFPINGTTLITEQMMFIDTSQDALVTIYNKTACQFMNTTGETNTFTKQQIIGREISAQHIPGNKIPHYFSTVSTLPTERPHTESAPVEADGVLTNGYQQIPTLSITPLPIVEGAHTFITLNHLRVEGQISDETQVTFTTLVQHSRIRYITDNTTSIYTFTQHDIRHTQVLLEDFGDKEQPLIEIQMQYQGFVSAPRYFPLIRRAQNDAPLPNGDISQQIFTEGDPLRVPVTENLFVDEETPFSGLRFTGTVFNQAGDVLETLDYESERHYLQGNGLKTGTYEATMTALDPEGLSGTIPFSIRVEAKNNTWYIYVATALAVASLATACIARALYVHDKCCKKASKKTVDTSGGEQELPPVTTGESTAGSAATTAMTTQGMFRQQQPSPLSPFTEEATSPQATHQASDSTVHLC